MIYLELFWSFFQVGLFSIGGGYAAMPLIQDQVVDIHPWLTMTGFADIMAIAEMTPGPIALNAATFVGIQVAGLPGALIAALDDSTSRSAATVWVTYYIALALLWPVRTNYGWLQMAQLVEKGAVFYRLNPNELPQAIPVLRDDAAYIVTSKADTVRAHTDIPIVTRLAPPVAVKSMRAFTGPLKLYTTKAAEKSQPMPNNTPTARR